MAPGPAATSHTRLATGAAAQGNCCSHKQREHSEARQARHPCCFTPQHSQDQEQQAYMSLPRHRPLLQLAPLLLLGQLGTAGLLYPGLLLLFQEQPAEAAITAKGSSKAAKPGLQAASKAGVQQAAVHTKVLQGGVVWQEHQALQVLQEVWSRKQAINGTAATRYTDSCVTRAAGRSRGKHALKTKVPTRVQLS